jgi:hypothetical protein
LTDYYNNINIDEDEFKYKNILFNQLNDKNEKFNKKLLHNSAIFTTEKMTEYDLSNITLLTNDIDENYLFDQ